MVVCGGLGLLLGNSRKHWARVQGTMPQEADLYRCGSFLISLSLFPCGSELGPCKLLLFVEQREVVRISASARKAAVHVAASQRKNKDFRAAVFRSKSHTLCCIAIITLEVL